ncbi:hypothetical protein [Azovibrio restrictus]|uniref:hypothetical protein n=1 Tax=Azovibrio restrictus TaxID=146938 RepID=UPI0012EB1DA4|nr:hypothetical protein [Azovibrio restrictus]
MALRHLSLVFGSVLVLAVRLGVGCFRLASSGFYGNLSLALRCVLVLARRLGGFGVATVNWKFQRNSKALGFGRLSAVGHFPGAAAGLGCWQFVGAGAFSAVSSNIPIWTPPEIKETER